MSLEKIHLRKLLQLFYLPSAKRTSALRREILSDIRRERREGDGGGDFHTPFWTDAKRHVAGGVDLKERSDTRIESNKSRARLYPQLTDGFLQWWNEKRRWRNEAFEFMPETVKAQFSIEEVGGIIKVENLLALTVGDQSNRIIYPYFSEDPPLPDEGGRIGLWLLAEALPDYRPEDLRILDILRSKSYATMDDRPQGNERNLFVTKYKSVFDEWKSLRREYE
jgi:hypothetical protein